MLDIMLSLSDRLIELAVLLHRQRGAPTHVAFDPAALADAAETLYGRRPRVELSGPDPGGLMGRRFWRPRFSIVDPAEAVHFKLRYG